MSHSKGFFSGTCSGNFAKYGKPNDGWQQLKCSRCGKLEQKRVSKCWFLHDYKNSGKPKFGDQKQKCSKCGDTRQVQRRPCFLFHGPWRRTRKDPRVRCMKCGIEKIPRGQRGEPDPAFDLCASLG